MLLPNNISSHIKECTAATCADSLLLVNKHVSDSRGGCAARLSVCRHQVGRVSLPFRLSRTPDSFSPRLFARVWEMPVYPQVMQMSSDRCVLC